MSAWKLQELRELIEKIHGDEKLSKASSHINSVDLEIRSACYHSYTASNAFSSDFEDEEHASISAIKMTLSAGEEASRFHEAIFIYEANITACAQVTRSAADIISHVILDVIAINGVDEENLNLKFIQKHVQSRGLKDKIVRVSGFKSFRYLQDVVNTTKHVRLVESEYTVDLTGKGEHPHGVRFKVFQIQNRYHPAKWGADFLEELK